jgi:3-oxoacyl-[acyl-carrier protein] reductase
MRFKDRVVIITGAGSGIGLAAAKAFVAEGASVAINDLNKDSVDAAVAEIEGLGGRAIGIPGDVSSSEDITKGLQHVVDAWGRVDVLISNAGIPIFEPAETYSQWQRSVATNLSGHFLWAQAVARQVMIPNNCGSIIFTSSLAGLMAYAGDIGYVTCKHALTGLTKGLSVEWAKYGIRVNSVAPGLTDSARLRRNMAEDVFANRVGRVPMGRIGQPEEQASAMLFLASDDASYITGHTMPVDGGQVAMHSGYTTSFVRGSKHEAEVRLAQANKSE